MTGNRADVMIPATHGRGNYDLNLYGKNEERCCLKPGLLPVSKSEYKTSLTDKRPEVKAQPDDWISCVLHPTETAWIAGRRRPKNQERKGSGPRGLGNVCFMQRIGRSEQVPDP